MERPVNKELLTKYLNGDCTQEELAAIHKFFKDPASQKLFDELIYEDWAQFQAEDIDDNQVTVWNERLKSRLNKQKEFFKIPAFFRYAAIWLLVLGSGTLFFVQYKKKQALPVTAMVEKNNAFGQRTVITLSDSSVVYLGAGSRIRFPETFSKEKREITLEGEAFFEVKHKKNQAFIVHTGEVQTRDIGTSFKITAFKDQPVQIALASGKVSVEKVKGKHSQVLANLLPGQQSLWKDNKLSVTDLPITDITGWKDGRLVFNEARLADLAAVLERWYNVQFTFKKSAKKDAHFTITLMANVPIEELMAVLSNTGGFTYKIHNHSITIN